MSNALVSSARDSKTRFRLILISPKQLWVSFDLIKSCFPFKDIEKSLGVCSGYLSRNRKNNNVTGIMAKLKEQPSIQGYIKQLVREDMKKKAA